MEKQEDKIVAIIGTTVAVGIVGAVVCGILECFGFSAGVVGGVFALITALPLPLYLICCACCWILRLFFPEWKKEKL